MGNPFSKSVRENLSENIKEYAEQFYNAAELLRNQHSGAGVSVAFRPNPLVASRLPDWLMLALAMLNIEYKIS